VAAVELHAVRPRLHGTEPVGALRRLRLPGARRSAVQLGHGKCIYGIGAAVDARRHLGQVVMASQGGHLGDTCPPANGTAAKAGAAEAVAASGTILPRWQGGRFVAVKARVLAIVAEGGAIALVNETVAARGDPRVQDTGGRCA